MATAAQIQANRVNAQSSTGPRTPEGKAKSAANATGSGLFSIRDLVRPDQESEYQELTIALLRELAPNGVLQSTLATEILRATWRLRRCAHLEASLLDTVLETGLDPMQNEATLKVQRAIDRARAQSLTTVRRCTADLRRLQTDRQLAQETLPGVDAGDLGLISLTDLWRAIHKQFEAKGMIAKHRSRSTSRQETVQTLWPIPTAEAV